MRGKAAPNFKKRKIADKCFLICCDKLRRNKQKKVIALKPNASLRLSSVLGALGLRFDFFRYD